MDKFVIHRSSSTSSLHKRTREDEEPTHEWQQPKRTATLKPSPVRPSLPTANRFSSLPTDEASKLSEPQRNAISVRRNPQRVPPITIQIKEGWTHGTMKDCIDKYSKKYHLQYRGSNKVAVQCYTSEDHQTVKEGLRAENIPFHTYTRKDEKMSKLVIRGLPAYFETTLADELKEIGFEGVIVTKLTTPSNKDTPCPPFMARLPPGTDVSKFRQIKYLGNCAVDIRRYRSNTSIGTQCFRCQHFGHAARNCNLLPRCVKCTGDHPTKDCIKKDRSTPAHCCNCGEEHPANYPKCPERQKYIEKLRNSNKQVAPPSKTVGIRPTKVITAPIQNRAPWKSITIPIEPPEPVKPWIRPPASVAAPKPSQAINTDPETQDHDETTKEILEIMVIIKNIKTEFIRCNSTLDKVVLVLTHLGQYV